MGSQLLMIFFGRMSKIFQKIDVKYKNYSVEEFRENFEKEARNHNWKKVHFRVYQRKDRKCKVYKVDMKNIKLYLSYIFIRGNGYYHYYSYYGLYFQMNTGIIEEIDIRETKLTPCRDDNLRIRKYFNKGTKKILNTRIS